MIDTFTAPAPQISPAVTAPTTPNRSDQASSLTTDFETFLQMLTAQARYQDPLKPIDSTEYSAQLAQFSMVEQQVKTNDTLAGLYEVLGVSNLASLAGWVGMEARAVTPALFDGRPITVSPRPAPEADKAYLVVRNETGAEVQRLAIPLSGGPQQWAGVDDDGTPLASGIYNFTTESFSEGTLIRTDPTELYGRIAEAQIEGEDVILVLEGGQTIGAGSVTALRQAL